jgi:hypothetical protein
MGVKFPFTASNLRHRKTSLYSECEHSPSVACSHGSDNQIVACIPHVPLEGNKCHISLGFDISPSTESLNLRCERKDQMNLVKLFENSNFDNLYSRHECHVVSEAFSMSKSTAAIDTLLLKLRIT